jgi:N utilization substance protein A
MNGEVLLQEIERIHRERDVDKEVIFQGLESALASAFRKKFENSDIAIDRKTGEIRALSETGEPIPTETLGRIAAQTAKQVLIQKIREAERNVIYDEFEKYKGDIVHGIIQRYEGSNVILNLNKTEGFLPKREQVRDENYTLGARMRAYVLDVEKRGHKVLTLLSRTYPDFVRRLFELEIPEIAERTIEIKGLVREAGYRTKIAVASFDSKVDCVGACVGVRGSRIKNIIEELQGEKIDIIRWSDNTEEMIRNALKPAEISEIKLDWEHFKASVYVETEQLSLAIGKRGQNVRLAAKLCGWDIDIISIPKKENPLRSFTPLQNFLQKNANKWLKIP